MDEKSVEKYIKENARPVELAWYKYCLEDGKREDVAEALATFQNPDGGFGHALEADFWNPASSPIATNDAIARLNYVYALDRNTQLVRDIVRYLKSGDGFDGEKKRWKFALESNRDFPHAIWWVPEDGSDGITDFNPTVSLATFMVCYSDDDGFYADIVREAYAFLEKSEKMSVDNLKCYILSYDMLVRNERTDIVDLKSAKPAIQRLMLDEICKDVSKYGKEYAATPSDFFNERYAYLYTESFKELVEAEKNNLKNIRMEDGGFDIFWKWYTDYPEFEEARKMWRPRISLERLLFWKWADRTDNGGGDRCTEETGEKKNNEIIGPTSLILLILTTFFLIIGTSEPVCMVLCACSFLASMVLAIYTRVNYPQNRWGKVMIILVIVFLAVSLIINSIVVNCVEPFTKNCIDPCLHFPD